MEALTLLLLFSGTLFVGIYTGMVVERRRAAQRKIQERIPSFPDEIVIIGNIHDKLSASFGDEPYIAPTPPLGFQYWDEVGMVAQPGPKYPSSPTTASASTLFEYYNHLHKKLWFKKPKSST